MLFEKNDTVVGTVVETNSAGAYISVDGTDMRAFYKGRGNVGDRVMLTVIIPEPRNYSAMYCLLDSVMEYAPVRSFIDVEIKLGQSRRNEDDLYAA